MSGKKSRFDTIFNCIKEDFDLYSLYNDHLSTGRGVVDTINLLIAWDTVKGLIGIIAWINNLSAPVKYS